MPADEKLIAWMIRLDLKDESPVPPEFYVQFEVLICSQELGDNLETPNPHIHAACLFSSPVSKQTLRNRLRKMFPDHSKADLCISAWKHYGKPEDDMFRYICKGPSKKTKTPPMILHNSTLENPLELHEAYWKKNADMKAETKAEGKVPPHEVIIPRCIKSEDYNEMWEEIVCKTLQYYRGKVNDHVAFPVIQACLYHFFPKRTEEDFRSRMARKFSSF